MDKIKLRAWWFDRQMFGASSPQEALARAGWARTVGGANPYLALFARTGADRADIDSLVAGRMIHELPSARGCTYLLPSEHYAVGLAIGTGDDTELKVAVKHLGVTEAEVESLCDAVLKVLQDGTHDPKSIRYQLGGLVRSFGDEGKKRGLTTNLPLALGRLQAQGRIRRVPVDGRLDNQRYAYAAWDDGPFAEGQLDRCEAYERFARLYFGWIGPASMKNFQWMSGLGVKAAAEATANLDLVPLESGSDLMASPQLVEEFESFSVPKEPVYRLTGSIDNLSHLRLGLADLLDSTDSGRSVPGEKGLIEATGLSELSSHAIFDRGRLIGVWDFDPETQEVVWFSWVDHGVGLRDEVRKTEAFVRDQLGDARTFSLDSPTSRKGRLDGLRALSSG